MTRRLAARTALAALLVLVGVAGALPLAEAEEVPPGAAPAPTPPGDADAISVKDTPVVILVKLLLAAAGGAVLIREYLRRDKVRGGLLPPPVPVEPTVPFSAVQAVGIFVLAFVSLEVVKLAVVRNRPELAEDLGFGFLATAAVELPLAAVVVLRRRRLGARTSPGSSAVRGLAAFLAAQAVILPVTFLWLWVVTYFGADPEGVQELAKKVVDPEEPWHPWAIAAFGVLVAPIGEEAIFRGMLYPAFRSAAGGGRKGAWVSAIVTSLFFAAIHVNLLAAAPLFVLAMILCWVKETTNSLLACTVCHAANNFVSIALLLWIRR